jgi:hypothetical protein
MAAPKRSQIQSLSDEEQDLILDRTAVGCTGSESSYPNGRVLVAPPSTLIIAPVTHDATGETR